MHCSITTIRKHTYDSSMCVCVFGEREGVDRQRNYKVTLETKLNWKLKWSKKEPCSYSENYYYPPESRVENQQTL